MNGKIEIFLDGDGVRIKLDVRDLSKIQIFGIVDALVDAFEFDSQERAFLAKSIAIGGIDSKRIYKE